MILKSLFIIFQIMVYGLPADGVGGKVLFEQNFLFPEWAFHHRGSYCERPIITMPVTLLVKNTENNSFDCD